MLDKSENRGGKREGAGRPKLDETVTIRIPASMVDTVKIMTIATKAGYCVEYRITPNMKI